MNSMMERTDLSIELTLIANLHKEERCEFLPTLCAYLHYRESESSDISNWVAIFFAVDHWVLLLLSIKIIQALDLPILSARSS